MTFPGLNYQTILTIVIGFYFADDITDSWLERVTKHKTSNQGRDVPPCYEANNVCNNYYGQQSFASQETQTHQIQL